MGSLDIISPASGSHPLQSRLSSNGLHVLKGLFTVLMWRFGDPKNYIFFLGRKISRSVELAIHKPKKTSTPREGPGRNTLSWSGWKTNAHRTVWGIWRTGTLIRVLDIKPYAWNILTYQIEPKDAGKCIVPKMRYFSSSKFQWHFPHI